MKDVLIGWISGDISEDIDHTVFSCDGDEGTHYNCEPLGNTILAGNGVLFDNGSDKDKPIRDSVRIIITPTSQNKGPFFVPK